MLLALWNLFLIQQPVEMVQTPTVAILGGLTPPPRKKPDRRRDEESLFLTRML